MALIFYGCHRRGGVERVVYEASHHLARRGHDVHVFAATWEPDKPDSGQCGITYHRVPVITSTAVLRSLTFLRNSTRLLMQHEFDVINSHGVFCPTGGVHHAHSVHRAWLECRRQTHAAHSARRIRQRRNPQHLLILMRERRHYVGGYRAIVAVSRQVAQDLNRLYGTPRNDIEIINNGYNPVEFNPARRHERRKAERLQFGLTDDETVLLMVANELERKGLPTVLNALHRLNRTDIKLLVAGRADPCPYRAKIAALGLQSRVVFTGPSSDVAALHAAADVFVLPTQYEAFCLAILEALGSGLPVITSAVPGAGDTIRNGINGLLLNDPCDDAELAQLIDRMLDLQERLKMDSQAADSVGAYHWDSVFERYERLLEVNTGVSAARTP